MTQVEMSAIASGSFLQSSMEIYAPLDGQGKTLSDAVVNFAQSKNLLTASSSGVGGAGGTTIDGGASNAGGAATAGGAGAPGTAGATNAAGGAGATAGSASASAGAAVDVSAGASNSLSGSASGCSCSLLRSQSLPAGGAYAPAALLALAGTFARSRRRRTRNGTRAHG